MSAAQYKAHVERAAKVATLLARLGHGLAAARMAGTARALRADKALWAALPLAYRGPRGRTLLLHAAMCGNAARVRFLLERGAAVDQGNAWGCTPLMHASENGHLETVRALLERGGAAVNAVTKEGFTALMWAAEKATRAWRACWWRAAARLPAPPPGRTGRLP